ncbi:lipid droplet-associated perilipin protein [Trametopsis cervina]|nr:lipid droplet-associated perilipin protein [Trametopsis cervina]
MATETETQPQLAAAPAAPELTALYRVASIPLVATSLDSIHQTLTNNPYTRTPYATAQGLSKAALGYTEPLQKTIAPLIVRADGLANKGLDVVEARYPYPFKTPTEDIVKDLRGRSDQAKDIANKTIDERFVHPAVNVAQGIDQRFAPVVDYIEVAVKKVHSQTGSPTAESPKEGEAPKFQYQRAYILSKDLTGQLYSFSSEQINQIKTQNAYVQRASEAAQRVSEVASTSYGAAQEKVQAVSDVMLQELQRVQQSTAALPNQLHASFHDISSNLTSTINDISAILSSPEPFQERAGKVRETVQQRVTPLLDATAARVQELLDTLRGKAAAEKQAVTEGVEAASDAAANGNGNGHTA